MTRYAGPYLLFAALTLAGCGPQRVPAAPTVPVKGKVVLAAGQPVAAGRVTFVPKDANMGGAEPFADLQKDGGFVLTTQKQGDGALVGHYLVWIDLIDYTSPQPKRIASSPVPTKYRSGATSDLVVEIKSGDNDLTLTLK